MAKVSKLLKVYKTKHPELGELIELYSPRATDGSSAYFIDEESVDQRNGSGQVETIVLEKGMGLRLTTKTAAHLAYALLVLVRKGPGKGVRKKK